MPYFWTMMSGKEKLRLIFIAILGLGFAYLYIQSQNIGVVVSTSEAHGIVHAIQATSPISGVASAFAVSVMLADGRLVSVEVPTSANVTVGDRLDLNKRNHESGRTSYTLKQN